MLRSVCLLCLGLSVLQGARPELRGVWVDRGPLASRESIRIMLDEMQQATLARMWREMDVVASINIRAYLEFAKLVLNCIS